MISWLRLHQRSKNSTFHCICNWKLPFLKKWIFKWWKRWQQSHHQIQKNTLKEWLEGKRNSIIFKRAPKFEDQCRLVLYFKKYLRVGPLSYIVLLSFWLLVNTKWMLKKLENSIVSNFYILFFFFPIRKKVNMI